MKLSLSTKLNGRRSRTLDNGRSSQNDSDEDHSTQVSSTGEFRFDQYLQAKWNQAMTEGIKLRNVGVVFKDLRVVGLGASTKYQDTVFSLFNPLNFASRIRDVFHPPVKDILDGFEGSVKPGEMLLVLGKPGSGCSTLLKVLANERKGYKYIYGDISYDGISPSAMEKRYRGDIAYVPEDDFHFPSLTVRQTLVVSTTARVPRLRVGGQSRKQYINNIVDILGKLFGLTHVFDTPVGDENIQGISGGEKKRVSIAETLSTRVRLASWDNSTRGLDASTALEFVQALRTGTDVAKATSIVSIYQASENIYRLFDKVVVIGNGNMFYFGPAKQARQYFIDMGYEPAHRQTSADFLVSVTDPPSRIVRKGYEMRVPRLPSEFAAYFLDSNLGRRNSESTRRRFEELAHQNNVEDYEASVRGERSRHVFKGSPYNIGVLRQLSLLMKRRAQILRGSIAPQVIIAFNFITQGLIMGSLFFNMPLATRAYFSRGGVLFFAILFSALSAMSEIPALYAQRPIVARHHRAALYHPFIDSLALTVVDMPISFCILILFDIIIYFMTRLKRNAGNFFIYVFFVFVSSLTMKAFYRSLAASFNKASGAQALAGLGTLILVIYTGYTIPRPTMIGALKWLTYLNPVTYAFEGLVTNEFHGLRGACSSLVPSGPNYENVNLANQVCTTLGSEPGSATVDGDQFIGINFGYRFSHMWRNLGILFVFWGGFLCFFLFMTERKSYISARSATQQLVFKRGVPDLSQPQDDPENGPMSRNEAEGSMASSPSVANGASDCIPPSRCIFSWHHLSYDVQISFGKYRRLLNDVSGYVVPGKLTALMGESGAGKTTLLNALAERLPTGIITGDRLVDGRPVPPDFSGKTGYCQQMDIHLETTTVREALQFSAVLRQPASVSKKEKYDYVEEVIKMCDMEPYADAIVGTVGQGLNVEQRKRLTVGVELAAKPELLLFLDEPTSGLSSQNAWSILKLLRSLADKGQAILCTIHQPSAELFEMFDRLLLLRSGGEICYFGDLGENTTQLIQYFEENGGRECQESENPAEYMLDVIGAGATAKTDIDWHAIWISSRQYEEMQVELQDIIKRGEQSAGDETHDRKTHSLFPAPVKVQVSELMKRGYQNYFRNPPYLGALSSLIRLTMEGLFIGFTFFKTKHNQRGIQNSIFACFMSVVLGAPLSNMIQVPFIRFRQVYETRERQSRMYHWISFITSCLLIELPFNIIGSTIFFFCWYWTVGWPNTPNRAGYQYFLYGLIFPMYYTTFSQAIAAASPTPEIASLVFGALYSIILVFSAIASADQILALAIPSITVYLSNRGVGNQWLWEYRATVRGNRVGGYLMDGAATSLCRFCPISSSNTFFANSNMYFRHRWRNLGFLFAYIVFNTFMIYANMFIFRIGLPNPLRPLIPTLRKVEMRIKTWVGMNSVQETV